MDKGYTMDQALAEASRCLLCHDAPCSRGCPAGTEPDRFIRKLRFRNLKGAVSVIKEHNILGGVCAVICPTCTLCERECLASGISRPIEIGKIQRFLVEYGWRIGFHPVAPGPSNGVKVAVIGAGPSGLACGAELAKGGYRVVVFEKLPRAGGMLQYAIPEHRLSREFVDREIADVEALGVEFKYKTPIETQADLDRLLAEGFEAVYVATGSWKCTGLNVPIRDSKDIFDAISFLALARRNPSGFADLVKGREVAVIGGGDTAIDAAVSARRSGAEAASIIYRRTFNEMPGSLEEKEAAVRAGVNLIVLTQPTDYTIEDGRAKGLTVVRNRLGALDESGRRRPVPIEGSEHRIGADMIVEAIGLVPDSSITQLSDLKFDHRNRIVVHDGGRTARERVFAGGDAVRGGSIVAWAVADGKEAARSIDRMFGGTSGSAHGE